MSEFIFLFATTQYQYLLFLHSLTCFGAYPHTIVDLRHKYQPIRATARGLFILLVTYLYFVEAGKPLVLRVNNTMAAKRC